MQNIGLASFFIRISLALFVGMVGYQKVFIISAHNHAQQFFINGFKEYWIPEWLLWALGYAIPYIELLCGLMLLIGLFVRWNLIVIGFLLLIVAYGHLLQDAFYNPVSHWLPRFILMISLLLLYSHHDRWSIENRWLQKK
ncbi:MAG: DoxX family membrane protein [Alcanivoracaceae bacterium]|nr:DoxX family membrane protein [Alcanivoracaceae bacterium]